MTFFNKTTTITGTAGNDTLIGDGHNNVINGLDGNDSIDASAGNDVVYGGAGDDSLSGGSGEDSVFGGAGDDRVFMALDKYVDEYADGGEGVDTLQLWHKDGDIDLHFNMEIGRNRRRPLLAVRRRSTSRT